MESFADVIRSLNSLRDEGIVEEYAIAGAMALIFWTEPTSTFDLDVLVLLNGENRILISLEPIYDWAAKHGHKVKHEHVIIKGVPVQFLPAYNDLADEAVKTADSLDYEGVPVRVVRPEYLIALALDPPAKTAKRKERAASLAESERIDTRLLEDVMKRYNLSW
jgi:hypothetical protein